jgi:16S rRNA processing protein RimM
MVCLGVIAGAHGVRGAVRVESFAANPADLTAYGALSDESGERSFTLTLAGSARGQLIARIEGVAERNAAEALKGTRLYVERAALPAPAAEEYYHSDLLGLRCESRDGTSFGTVTALYNFGAGDVIEVEREGGVRILLPFTGTVVPLVDVSGGRLVVEPPPELDASSHVDAEEGEER